MMEKEQKLGKNQKAAIKAMKKANADVEPITTRKINQVAQGGEVTACTMRSLEKKDFVALVEKHYFRKPFDKQIGTPIPYDEKSRRYECKDKENVVWKIVPSYSWILTQKGKLWKDN